MTRIGIAGLGFIGKMHLATLRRLGMAEVVAVADRATSNLAGVGGQGGNIAVDTSLLSLDGVAKYDDGERLLADPKVDAVLIALPTHLHKDFALRALATGKHVICEKPLARTSAEGLELVDAAAASDRVFCVAHCIRFWPAYEAARALIQGRTYGKAIRAHFARVSPKPTWSWQQWLMDEDMSGGALLDLHIHDVDYVNAVFGPPAKVEAEGTYCDQEGVGDVLATYTYDDGCLVTIEGSWNQHPGFPFRMAFRIACEHATLEFNTLADGKLHVYPATGGEEIPDIGADDGYTCEHRYFLECIEEGRKSERVTVQSSCDALALVEKERACLG